MNKMPERITSLIRATGLTKTAFAARLNVGQPFVSKLASGASEPSDRTIADIVREFNVNETWLRTGEGEMFAPVSRDERIADFIGSLLREEDDSFKRRFVAMLSRLDEDDWAVLEKMALGLNKAKKD